MTSISSLKPAFPSLWNPPSTFCKMRLLLTLTLSPSLRIWYFELTAMFLIHKGGSGIFANCSFCGTKTALSFSAVPVCSTFSAEACAILHALCWSHQHHQFCHFSSLLLLSDSRLVLSSIFPSTSNSLADLAGAVFPLLLCYQATMGFGAIVSPGQQRG